MVYIKELGIYVNKIEDLRDKVSEDMYAAIEYLVSDSTFQEEYDSLKSEYDSLKSEFESYEWSLEENRNTFSEILDLVDDFENKLDELLEYLNSARRMNREKIFQDILNIKLDSIRKSIMNVY